MRRTRPTSRECRLAAAIVCPPSPLLSMCRDALVSLWTFFVCARVIFTRYERPRKVTSVARDSKTFTYLSSDWMIEPLQPNGDAEVRMLILLVSKSRDRWIVCVCALCVCFVCVCLVCVCA